MRLKPPRGLISTCLSLSILLAAAGCAATPPIEMTPPALNCAALIPPSARQPVSPALLPAVDATAGAVWSALDDQTGRLDQANGRIGELAAIADACQAQQARVTSALTPKRPWWRVWE